MDLNPDAELWLRGGTQFMHQDCSQEWRIEPESLDVVFTSNFLEHLPGKDSVERIISEAHRCLKKDGLIICLGPNIKYVPGAYWDFWDHLIPITELSLSEFLAIFDVDRKNATFVPGQALPEYVCPMAFVWKTISRRGEKERECRAMRCTGRGFRCAPSPPVSLVTRLSGFGAKFKTLVMA
jgi:SAM-dependent methyltransferase